MGPATPNLQIDFSHINCKRLLNSLLVWLRIVLGRILGDWEKVAYVCRLALQVPVLV